MEPRNHKKLLSELADAYARHAPRSAELNERAKKHLIDGGSHTMRLIQPFPPRIVAARGAWLRDADGHDVLDFWQGHYTNILGHNPPIVTEAIARALADRFGLQTGMADELEIEAAEVFCRQTNTERVRFTTSGSLATMYAILLSTAFTQRDLVIKIGGGWHGAQPWALKGVDFQAGQEFHHLDTEGVPAALTDRVVVTRFNDPEMLRDHFREFGNRAAAFIVEPFLGAKGFLPGTREYLQTARELTEHYGTVLIFDEVISGFRFRAGDLAALYGIRPDLSTYGKIIGGGMPVAAVAGRAEIMNLAGQPGGGRVKFSGGTYSAHPASMLAARIVMSHLASHEAEIYPRLGELGARTRRTIEAAFAQEGIHARCTGDGNETLRGSSMAMVHFPYQPDCPLLRPDDVRNPAVCDLVLGDKAFQLALLLENVHVVHGLGALSTAHTDADIEFLGEAIRRAARRIRAYL